MRARLCRSPGQHPPCLQLTMRDLHEGPARFRNGTARPAAWCFLHALPVDCPGMQSAASAAGNATALQIADSAGRECNARHQDLVSDDGRCGSAGGGQRGAALPKGGHALLGRLLLQPPAADHLAAQRVHGRRLGEGRAARRERPVAGEAKKSPCPKLPDILSHTWSPLYVRYAPEQQAC